MAEDWYVASIDRIEKCASDLRHALDGTLDALRVGRQERLDGVPFAEIVTHNVVDRGGTDLRRSVDAAFRSYADAINAHRALVVRALVDDEGMPMSAVAGLLDVSRQMIGRLYGVARRTGTVGPEDDG